MRRAEEGTYPPAPPMATRTPTLSQRLGFVAAQATFVQAALLAAHGARAREGGFRPSDVRFFFLLFSHWAEHDVTRPSQDIDLTQVRRTLVPLVQAGWAERVSGAGRGAERTGRPAPRGKRYVLTAEGLVGLAERLAAADRLPLEEALFVVCFAASYRDAVLTRVEGRGRAPSASVRRRVERALDPVRLVASARRTAASLLEDLEEREVAGFALQAQARAALEHGVSDAELARRVEDLGGHQLQRVRPLGELLLALPEDLRRFELTEGMGLRSWLLFAPLAERARAEVAVLERLERALAAGERPGPSGRR